MDGIVRIRGAGLLLLGVVEAASATPHLLALLPGVVAGSKPDPGAQVEASGGPGLSLGLLLEEFVRARDRGPRSLFLVLAAISRGSWATRGI